MTTLRVKEICREKGMTLADLAARMDISASALSQSLKKPSFDTLEKLGLALGVEVAELFEASRASVNCPHCGKPLSIKVE